jgi:hypothetical protein
MIRFFPWRGLSEGKEIFINLIERIYGRGASKNMLATRS